MVSTMLNQKREEKGGETEEEEEERRAAALPLVTVYQMGLMQPSGIWVRTRWYISGRNEARSVQRAHNG